jgi:uncharacterized membrane protein
MYRILGSDGKEYGPVSIEQLSRWIRERRVNGDTRVQGENGEWRLLREVPELVVLLQPPVFAPQLISAPTKANSIPSDFDGDYDLDIGACLGSAWNFFRRQSSSVIAPMMVYMAIVIGFGILGAVPYVGPAVSLVSMVVGGALLGGLYFIYLRMIRGENPPLQSLFDGFRKAFGQLFMGQFVPSIAVILPVLPGFIVLFLSVGWGMLEGLKSQSFHWPAFALMVPGLGLLLLGVPFTLYLTVNWMFTLPLILDHEIDFWTAMKRSWRQVSRNWWSCLALSVVIAILNFFGMLCCLVGLLVTFPISVLATVYAYETVIHGRKAS